MTMRFKLDKKKYLLQGLLTGSHTMVSCVTLSKLLRQEKEAMLIQVYPMVNAKGSTSEHPAITRLLKTFSALFDNPTGLPLSRRYDHKTELLLGTPPMNVRSYHYPHFQKIKLRTFAIIYYGELSFNLVLAHSHPQ